MTMISVYQPLRGPSYRLRHAAVVVLIAAVASSLAASGSVTTEGSLARTRILPSQSQPSIHERKAIGSAVRAERRPAAPLLQGIAPVETGSSQVRRQTRVTGRAA
ncbi:hypothetical protein GCM10011324_35860 [Allosediminivita pacifica]|uniref:Uncharacterized protein n=1 Tax=Allosediminivita pacifica TaxID=1267769 RepID=A0A2T6AD76_9RHOB|nr:hypothetical protein C8N44_12735 [Allosediminivita pacifica]GGB22677.1 hypothetical protein GCM10011324_35860 [Allosediminivita pacifica]